MSTATPTREDRSLAARIAFYEERPWVRPNVERWVDTGDEGADGDLAPVARMACMIAEHRATVYLTAFYKGVEAAVKEVEDVVKTCDIYVAASTPSPNAEHESLALPFHEARKQGAVRCLKRIQGLIGLSELTKKTP